MESTAQYWRPVWEALEQHWRPRRRARDGAPRLAGTLHLAQAQSNRGAGGRKRDFPRCSGVARKRGAASFAKAAGAVSPSASACSMRRALMPSRSETRLDTLMCASSSSASKSVVELHAVPGDLVLAPHHALRRYDSGPVIPLSHSTRWSVPPMDGRLPRQRRRRGASVREMWPRSRRLPAMICCAESTPRPGTSARRCTASWCAASRSAIC
jgi:hypothetical protein